jgi:hypothetical protein
VPCVREEGFEPSRPCGHQYLRLACLPFHHKRIYVLRTTPGTRTPTALILSQVPPTVGLERLTVVLVNILGVSSFRSGIEPASPPPGVVLPFKLSRIFWLR